MGLIAYTNNNKHTVHVGGKAIAPGHTRPVEERYLASYKPVIANVPADESATPLTDRLNEMRLGSIATVTEQFSELSDEELSLLEVLESESEAPRKGLLEAILSETVERANLALDGNGAGEGDKA